MGPGKQHLVMKNVFLSAKNLRVSCGDHFQFCGRNLAQCALTEIRISKDILRNNKPEYVMSIPLFCMNSVLF